uniref:Uncharacterized protein n=1 Tax=Lotharella oceanica TaxID=641309 RepID=A0A7S2TU28_9EUKA|mmetsp:Transcript_3000/g.5829  ORF Transcript_3000/g.5829 Transcript_3000/m.5829 type:complete len:349 (+) Transcript_3000:63-1109(+)|eukprot:CAMPEP_0170199978 /NCGR_PEP_ID=MMETSP0040_2-20121228/69631_1 /TAXON_ID=641309 /ORGANISM="Lotharella oceanica, Strain CCMP622" /LENGTH=348 /DNA_ID=CAMNT_0010450141 /DNA_START=473 /DNA_END=1519 /DNA_ORIENTATION=-
MDVLSIVLSLMLIVVGAGLGATIQYQEVLTCLKEKRIAATVGVLTQFGLMPLIAYFYANVFNFSDEHAIGLMLIASAPGGVTSNLITYWSGGDVMLSITMSAVSTILAFGMMPLLIEIYINTTFADGGLDIPYQWIFITLLLLIIPCAIGVWVRAKSEVWAKRMEKSGSVIGVIFLVIALIYGIYENKHLFNQSFGLWWSGCTLQLIGSTFAYFIAGCSGLGIRSRRTISIEAGIQNATLVITMVTNSFSDEDERTQVLVPVLIYSIAYFWNSVLTLGIFRAMGTPPDETDSEMEKGAQNGKILDGNSDNVNLQSVKVEMKEDSSLPRRVTDPTSLAGGSVPVDARVV